MLRSYYYEKILRKSDGETELYYCFQYFESYCSFSNMFYNCHYYTLCYERRML